MLSAIATRDPRYSKSTKPATQMSSPWKDE